MSCLMAHALDRDCEESVILDEYACSEALFSTKKPLAPRVIKSYIKRLALGKWRGVFFYGPSLFTRLQGSSMGDTGSVFVGLLDRIRHHEAVFAPLQDPLDNCWSLCVFVKNLDSLLGGTVFVVQSVDLVPPRPGGSLDVIDHIIGQWMPEGWKRRHLPCHQVLVDPTVSGVRMLHHLHVLLHARFWESKRVDTWLENGGLLQ